MPTARLLGPYTHGRSATDPTVPTPLDGDTYFNTTIAKSMFYDNGRSKWLSFEALQIAFGRAGQTGSNAFYRGIDRRAFTATNGRTAEHNGTITGISYTRNDADAATFEVTADGTLITGAVLASSANSGKTTSLDSDFSEDEILGVRNQTGSNTTAQVMGWVTFRWRS